ncbi:MAG: hypothetical protein AAGA80_12265 [Cyanobacteria bacterium P01_F01_bin.143]
MNQSTQTDPKPPKDSIKLTAETVNYLIKILLNSWSKFFNSRAAIANPSNLSQPNKHSFEFIFL